MPCIVWRWAVGKTGRGGGAGVGDQWVKLGDWELGDHVINIRCFHYKFNWMEVCSKFDGAYFLGMLQS